EDGLPTAVDRPALLRAMDLNMWEMFRDGVRVGRGGEVLDRAAVTMCASPHGTSFYNMAMVRGAIDPAALLDGVRDFYARRSLPFSIWTRAHADQDLEAALQ